MNEYIIIAGAVAEQATGLGFTELIVTSIITFVFGGGFLALTKTLVEGRKAKAQNKQLGIKTPIEIRQIEMSTADVLIENLQDDNRVLRVERDYWKTNYTDMKQQVDQLLKQLDDYRDQVKLLQVKIEHNEKTFVADHKDAHDAGEIRHALKD